MCTALVDCFAEESEELVRNAHDNLCVSLSDFTARPFLPHPIHSSPHYPSPAHFTSQLIADKTIPVATAHKKHAAALQAVVASLGAGLRFRFQRSHSVVMKVLAAMFLRLGPAGPAVASDIVVSLGEVCFFMFPRLLMTCLEYVHAPPFI